VPGGLKSVLGDVGATFTFELDVDGANEPVEVEAPENPKPASELPGG